MIIKDIKKVIIDPSCRIVYSAYYIKGLYDVFGKKNVSFSAKYFKELKRKEESSSWEHYMAFVVKSSDKKFTKIIIDFRDKTSVKESAYQWSDIYAKINFNRKLTPERFHTKIISIPPGFGYKIWNIWQTAYYCGYNYIKCKFSPLVNLKVFLADYYNQYKRLDLDEFADIQQTDSSLNQPYVFFNMRLWPHENCIEGTNLHRKQFVELCKTMECNFEGGFFASADQPQYKEFKNLICPKVDSKSYFEKTKLSAFVFNTPAVHNCHGWKLGEFLAFGKAIISTPLSNELPVTLTHGKHIHYASNLSELKSAIKLLSTDKNYRRSLEKGAREYYLKYSNPRSVIEQIITNKNPSENLDSTNKLSHSPRIKQS